MSEKIEILVTGVAQQQVFPTQSGKDQLLMQLNRVDSFVGADAKLNINPLYKKKTDWAEKQRHFRHLRVVCCRCCWNISDISAQQKADFSTCAA